ncbi:MAG: hypothetical protein OEY97_09180 [Nitrospirota bacterium]|nr:hypothetical protein [Nitrospirota bacterium]
MGIHPMRTACLFLVVALWLPGVVRAADVNTVNDSEGTAAPEFFNRFESAPASCTGANTAAELTALESDLIGMGLTPSATIDIACGERGAAIAAAAAAGTLFDSTWSDLLHNYQGITFDQFRADGKYITGGGDAFIPAGCWGPECGHMLKGDSQQWDVNGDGVNDFSMNDQFSWGTTSYIVDTRWNSLVLDAGGSGISGMAPGVTRMLIRQALGSVSYVTKDSGSPDSDHCSAILKSGPVADDPCRDGVIDSVANTGSVDINSADVDPDVYARCDPDYFHPDTPPAAFIAAGRTDPGITTVEEGQRALYNCLMRIAATPLTGPEIKDSGGTVHSPLEVGVDLVNFSGTVFAPNAYSNTSFDPGINARDQWVDQVVIGYIEDQRWVDAQVGLPSQQDYSQKLYAAAGFRGSIDTLRASYVNDTQVSQMDRDWDPNNNLPGSPSADTYNYAFRFAISTASPQRTAPCDPGVAPDCVGRTNNTLDPLWGGAAYNAGTGEYDFNLDLGFFNNPATPGQSGNTDFGIGQTNDLAELVAQDVEGYLFSCLNCDTPELTASGGSTWWQSYFDANRATVEVVDLPTFQPFILDWNTVPSILHAPTP